MGFWSRLFDREPTGITQTNPSAVPPSVGAGDYTPGDPEGVDLSAFADIGLESRSLPQVSPSPWDGWPAEWNVPNWGSGSRLNSLVDIAWACLDLNSNVLSSMPVFRTRSGDTIPPTTWMENPDPEVYASWEEFAKQLFWDYQLGEAFVRVTEAGFDGFPLRFRVVPPWLIDVEIRGGRRIYRLGGPTGADITPDILHIRYKSTTDAGRGSGPLEAAGGRVITAGVIAKYVREVVMQGGLVDQTLESDLHLEPEDVEALGLEWVNQRVKNPSRPPILTSGLGLKNHFHMSPKDMAMIEISNFTEARVAVLLGVPPFLVALPMTSGEESLTYSNSTNLFEFHDRASLKPRAQHVMSALSTWALPRGQKVKLNRDEYSRPSFNERAEASVKLVEAGMLSVDEWRQSENLTGPAPARPQPPQEEETETEAVAEVTGARSNGRKRQPDRRLIKELERT